MTAVIKIILGLFIWLALPPLIIKKKRSPYKKFVNISCMIIGILIVIYGAMDLLKYIVDF